MKRSDAIRRRRSFVCRTELSWLHLVAPLGLAWPTGSDLGATVCSAAVRILVPRLTRSLPACLFFSLSFSLFLSLCPRFRLAAQAGCRPESRLEQAATGPGHTRRAWGNSSLLGAPSDQGRAWSGILADQFVHRVGVPVVVKHRLRRPASAASATGGAFWWAVPPQESSGKIVLAAVCLRFGRVRLHRVILHQPAAFSQFEPQPWAPVPLTVARPPRSCVLGLPLASSHNALGSLPFQPFHFLLAFSRPLTCEH